MQRREIRLRLHRWVAGDLGSQSRGLLQILPSEAGSVHLSESELPGGAMVPEEDAFTADHPWTPAETRGLIHWCLIQHDNQHLSLHTKVRLLFSPLTVWQVVCLSSIWIDWTHYKVGNISSPWIKSDKNGYPTKYETEKSILFSTNPLLRFYRQVGNWNHNYVCVCVCSVVSDSLVTPSTVVHQIPLSMESFGKNTIVGSISFSGDLSDPGPSLGIFLTQGLNLHLLWSSELQADSLPTKP